ncbi:3-deoxy-manno-octulosonate cytidylyltransferase [[Ruminococcus] torques]|uniref:3-deoxy-manno-octulosonate cytidylyltransferase n=1 Tax=[Ruminococcus] torques TaxID=33039 RepID=UPI0025A3E1B3|nr:3-deoxy-manno-octulosonate cytidylyltransferase [[Ruminococcus] torques]MDM8236968.1 3-deoxy-manno-octulosonate cytidylyltransferase [[Ruminococcus] torques]
MKIIGVIPSRYASTRFPGKGLADICGKPMVWWVYQSLRAARGIDEAYVATDDLRIVEVCEKEGIPTVLTSDQCPTHLERLYEVSEKIDADFYINVNGDEPLIESTSIEDMIPRGVDPNESYFANAMMVLRDPIDAFDTSKIKIATDVNGYGMYMARSPIPYPKARGDFQLKKFVGIQCFTKKALQFVVNTPRGELESIEDIDEFRFLENGHKVKFIMTEATTLSVDTKKDLEKVRLIMKKRLEKKE